MRKRLGIMVNTKYVDQIEDVHKKHGGEKLNFIREMIEIAINNNLAPIDNSGETRKSYEYFTYNDDGFIDKVREECKGVIPGVFLAGVFFYDNNHVDTSPTFIQHAKKIDQLIDDLLDELEFFKNPNGNGGQTLAKIVDQHKVGYMDALLRALYTDHVFERAILLTQFNKQNRIKGDNHAKT